MKQLDTKLIENALAITGKTMEDMYQRNLDNMFNFSFSIEKFCYYLLSKPFLTEYVHKYEWWIDDFWNAIFQYQDWNEKPLKELLSKIWN